MTDIKCVFVSVLLMIVHSSNSHSESYNDQFITEKSSVIAITNARLIDGTGAKAKENQTVLIRDGRIVNIGQDGSMTLPTDAKRVSLKGKSLLPGWVMTHEHLFSATILKDISPHLFMASHPISYPRLLLSVGVTSARTAGTRFPYTDLRVRSSIAKGELLGPDYDLTAPTLTVLEEAAAPLKSAEDARDRVRFWADKGFTSIKVRHLTQAQMAASIDEAHKHGLKVTGHIGNVTYRQAIDLGIDQIEHGFWSLGTDFDPHKTADVRSGQVFELTQKLDPQSEKVQRLFTHLIENRVAISSTLDVFSDFYNTDFKVPLPEHVANLMSEERRALYESNLMSNAAHGKSDTDYKAWFNNALALEYAFWRAGGTLVVGSDAVFVPPGYSNLRSIEFLAKAGIPPLDVITIATKNGAEALGIADDRGTIEVGKRADLIVINGDPSTNISDIYKVNTVYKNGIGYNPEALRKSVEGKIGMPY